MEKISKILPSSPRIKSVSFSDGGRMRPGMPNFGVPIGRSSLSPVDKFTKSNAALKLGQEFTSTDWKVRDMAKAGMVGKLSQTFFANRTEDADKVDVVSPMFRVPEELLQEIREEEGSEIEADDGAVDSEFGSEDAEEGISGNLVGVIVLEPAAMDELQDYAEAEAYADEDNSALLMSEESSPVDNANTNSKATANTKASPYKSEAMAAYGAATVSSLDTSTLDYTA